MKKSMLWMLLILFCGFSLVSCSDDSKNGIIEQPEDTYDGIPIVIYDTDIGSSTDDLFALGLIYYMAHEGNCKLIGGVVCRMGEEYVKLADLMNTYWGFGDLPLGVERNGVANPNTYIPYSGIADLTNNDGTPMFKRSISDYSALPDGWKLYRKLLSEQPDHSVRICAIGFMSIVAQLLKSGPDEYSQLNGVDLVAKKVRGLYVMGGKFGEEGNNKVGYNFGHQTAVNFSIDMLDLWPKSVPIYFSPSLPGDYLDYPVEEVLADLEWIDAHPIKQVYLNYNCNTGQRMWDTYPALMTVGNAESVVNNAKPGFVKIIEVSTDDNGDAQYEMMFEPDPKGNCYYQELYKERIPLDMILIKAMTTSKKLTMQYINP